MIRYRKHAFSLIELSIVILVIGIFITGISASVGMIKKFRISTARALTTSSPVNSIEGLELWLEPTMEKSFLASETEDGTNLSQWNDINSQNLFKYHAIKTATSEVKYEDSAIGNLPSLYFNGTPSTNSYFTLSKTTSPSNNTLIILNDMARLTFFVVSQANKLSTYNPVFYNGVATDSDLIGWGYELFQQYPTFRGVYGGFYKISSIQATVANTTEIVSFTISSSIISDHFGYNCGQSGSFELYVNGARKNYGTTTGIGVCTTANAGIMRIGGYRNANMGGLGSENDTAWNGYISEIIIFSKALKAEERKSIEQYLSQKYSVRLNS